MNSPAFDLSFEEITANIQRLKQAQITHSVQVPNEWFHYLEDIQSVNDALSQSARIAIRVHHHSLTCLPGEALPSCPPPPGCLLILKKIVVTCAQFAQSQLYSISLQFWDDTHEKSTIWSATTAQPQSVTPRVKIAGACGSPQVRFAVQPKFLILTSREMRELRSTSHGTGKRLLNLPLCRPGLKVLNGVRAVFWA